MNLLSAARLGFCALSASLAASTSVHAAEPVFGREGTVKVRASGSAVTALQAAGGRLVADYGAFSLIEVPSSAARATDGIEVLARENQILLNTGAIDTTTPAASMIRGVHDAPTKGKGLHLVQFAGPIVPQWLDALKGTGVEIVTYIPNNAYLVYGDATALSRMTAFGAALPQLQWDGDYLPDYKIDPAALAVRQTALPEDAELVSVQLVADAGANAATLQWIDANKSGPIRRAYESLGYYNVFVPIPQAKLFELARLPDVVSIQADETPQMFCERQDQIVAGNLSGNIPSGPGYLAWLMSKGFTQAQFTASNFVVDVSDSSIDQGNTTPNHFGLWQTGVIGGVSHIAYQRRISGTTVTTPSPQKGCDGHGTLNAHIVGGYSDLTGFPFADASGFRFGLGVCPFVKVGGSGIFTSSGSFTSPNLTTIQSNAYNDGARVSSNSWGNTSGNTYNADAQTYDGLVRDAQPAGSTFPTAGNQEMTIVFAAGNAGSSSNTVRPPGTGKNLIVVGAAENVQAFGGADNCNTTDAQADSANDIVPFSSRGPCSDGRKKPDIMAPGTHVSGGVNQTSTPGATGQSDCFTGGSVCRGFNSLYFPNSGQQFYTASSGTSHSTPCVSGGCALVRQSFINQSMLPPSPAMTKAVLMNSARYMTGVGANDTLYSNNQGMGEMNLGEAFDRGPTPTVFRDQLAGDMFTATGQSRLLAGAVADPSKAFRVTLAWTDAPGATSGAAWKNDLNLVVTIGDNTYLGNVFSGANSVTGGSADGSNNVESVFLPAGATGPFTVTVSAANINSDGVPNVGGAVDQDFALVIYNGTTALVPVIAATGSTLTAESCPNGAVDPNETVTLSISLQNVGAAATTNLVATLLPTGGVTAPSGPQSYGVLSPGGAAVTRSFSFTANGSCGSILTATLQLQDGASSLGTVPINMMLGTTVQLLAQNFDSVTAPALPAGWTSTSVSGGSNLWTTTSTVRDSLPNSATIPNPSTTSEKILLSPTIAVQTTNATLTFRNSYNTEANWDGGVLEVSIGGGAFADIVTAGGMFLTGGYNTTINSGTSNPPLATRQAWSGNSGGFLTTTVKLPMSANGQNIQLRWRFGSDSSVGGSGWWVDTLSVSEPSCCVVPVCSLLGDVNGDATINGRDIRPFIECLVSGTSPSGVCACGDYNASGAVDSADIGPFANALLSAP